MQTTKNTTKAKTELKLDLVALVQKRSAEREAKERYERELEERKENFELIVAPIAIILAMGGFFHLTVYLLDLVILGGMM